MIDESLFIGKKSMVFARKTRHISRINDNGQQQLNE